MLRALFTAPEELRPRIEPARDHREGGSPFRRDRAKHRRLAVTNRQPSPISSTSSCSCMFAEDAGLLPRGILSRLSAASKGRSDVFTTHSASCSQDEPQRRLVRRRGDRLVQRRPVRLRQRHPADRHGDHDPPRGQQARLGAGRTRDLRNVVRARPRPRASAPNSARTTPTARRSGASSSRSSCVRCGARRRRCRCA